MTTKKAEITFDSYQEFTNTTVKNSIKGDISYFTLGLASEAGEVADIIKKAMRDSSGGFDADALTKELGDVLYYIAQIAECAGIRLESVAVGNQIKLQSRLDRNKIGGSGDNR